MSFFRQRNFGFLKSVNKTKSYLQQKPQREVKSLIAHNRTHYIR
jgi:uncharacterized C2H2 Zn-finger protein